jgi:hypothetical protein
MLCTLHYVWAAIAGLGGCAVGGFLFFVTEMLQRAADAAAAAPPPPGSPPGATNQAPPPEMMEMFRWMYGGMGVMYLLGGLTMSVLAILTARAMASRRRRMFCIVASAVQCLAVPFGTGIGIFTILVLSRESVVRRFDGGGGAR